MPRVKFLNSRVFFLKEFPNPRVKNDLLSQEVARLVVSYNQFYNDDFISFLPPAGALGGGEALYSFKLDPFFNVGHVSKIYHAHDA